MATTDTTKAVRVDRYFSQEGQNPYDQVEWEQREASVGDFEAQGLTFPVTWSQNATNIVAQKYFRTPPGQIRETSVKQMIQRVTEIITDWGTQDGYFSSTDADVFRDELTHLLLNQMASFNSPVWFNVGVRDVPQCSACFILSVGDTMESLLDWNSKEGMIFKGGSGSGVNLSNVRGSKEQLSIGGTASGPVSFMRGTDSWAGSIKSGGSTRRAAKMVVLDVDHPDIHDFVVCKAVEEDKATVLREAGYDMSLNGVGFLGLQYQNANNSVRVTDEFMKRARQQDQDLRLWELRARKGKSIVEQVDASWLLDEISEAAWRCADPGVQYDDMIQHWHTCPNSGRINASNPCSEYMHIDDSACNLASLNLMKFRGGGNFDSKAFCHATDVMILAMELLVSRSSYPTPEITENAMDFRQLGLGYANLGALLMSDSLPYDSVSGRNVAAAITALMTGRAYRRSAEIASVKGSYKGFQENREPHMRIMRQHTDALNLRSMGTNAPGWAVKQEAKEQWTQAIKMGEEHGYRNAQATVLAPTGTIAFMMDCDTTGVEPAFSLVTYKDLVGGGELKLVNHSAQEAMHVLGYDERVIDAVEMFGSADNLVKEEHEPIFHTAGEISAEGHVRMMGAVQPFISGAISKTVNMAEGVTPNAIRDIYELGWKEGLKAIAIYRENSKGTQPQRRNKDRDVVEPTGDSYMVPERRKMPRTRQSKTHKFTVAGYEGYVTAGMYDTGECGEIFLSDIGKGSTMTGMMDAFATSFSIGLQYGVPLEMLCRKFSHMRFDPEGPTGNREIPHAHSLVDYIVRWLASEFLSADICAELGVMTEAVKMDAEANLDAGIQSDRPSSVTGIPCTQCGAMMQRTGSCLTCSRCGQNTGCG